MSSVSCNNLTFIVVSVKVILMTRIISTVYAIPIYCFNSDKRKSEVKMEVNKKDQNENNFLFAERFNALKSLQSKETRAGCLQGQH